MERTTPATPTPPEHTPKVPDDEMLPLELKVEEIAGFALLVLFSIDKKHSRYLIGVEMARILKQQTYNMYRSLKSKGIHLIRANQHCLSFLRDKKAVPRNTHSVTLVPYSDGVRFILTKLREKQRIEMESKAVGLLSTTPTAPSSLYHIPSAVKPKTVPTSDASLPSIFSFSPSFSRGAEHPPPPQVTPTGFPVNRFQLFSPQVPQVPVAAPPALTPRQQLHTPFYQEDPQMNGDFSTLFSLACLSEIEAKKLSQKTAAEKALLEKKELATRAAAVTVPAPKGPTTTTDEKTDPADQPLLSKGWIQLLLNSASPSVSS